MTVRYLRTIQRQQISASVNNDPAKLGQYRSGYAECVNEVTRYLGATSATGGAPELRTQIVGHLANLCTSGQQQQPSPTKTTSPPQHHHQQQTYYAHNSNLQQQQQQVVEPPMVYTDAVNRMSPSIDSNTTSPVHRIARSPVPEGAHPDYALTTPVYNTQSHQVRLSPTSTNSSSVVVSPSADVASGEITLVLPQQALPNGQLPTHFIPVYAQGPVVPTANNQALSPSHSDVSYRSVSPLSAGTALPASPVSTATCSSPVTVASSPVSYVQQLPQTELSPVIIEQYAKYETATPISNQCVSKKESMWRPW